MLRWSSSVSSRTSIPTDSTPRKCKGANQKLCLLPGMYVCMYVFIRILPTGWEGMPIHTIHAWFSINHWNRSNLVLWYTPMIHWLMVMILIILISLSLCLSLCPSRFRIPTRSRSLQLHLFLRFDCNHMHFAEHYHTKFHPIVCRGEINLRSSSSTSYGVNKQTNSAI